MSHTTESPDRRRRRKARGALARLSTNRHPRLRIYAAIPEQSARARHQGAYMSAFNERLDEETGLGRLRADAATNTRAITWLIARYTDWPTMTCRIGWQNLVDLSGLSRATVRRVIRRLRDWGFLGVVETGSTWWTRGCDIDDRDGNRGAVYVLCVPGQEPVEISDPPSLGSRREPEKPHVRARENQPQADTEQPWPMHQPTVTRQDRLAAAKRLQAEAPMLARITPQLLRHILRPQLTAGWTVADILYALDHEPDGTPHWHTTDVWHVAAWIRHRLKAWAGHQPPRPVGVRQSTALDAVDVAALPRATDPAEVDIETHASLARRLLAATKRRSDKPARRGLGVLLPGLDGGFQTPAVDRAPVGGSRYDADDPRRIHAERADRDKSADLAAAAEAAERSRQPAGVGGGFDWLIRGLQQRPAPGRAIA